MIGDVLWTPPADARQTTEVGRFMDWLRDERGHDFEDFDALWRWSVDDLEGFWGGIWDFYGVRAHTPYERVLERDALPGARWFPGARLNYAEHMVGLEEDLDRVAVVARSQSRPPIELTFRRLREQVARTRAGLQRLGVGPGDRVVAYLPNIPETLVAFIATASLGAVWASCAPEFGARSVVDRLAQIEPKVLLAVAGYGWRDKAIDRREELAAIRAGLPTLEHVVAVPYGPHPVPDALSWEELTAQEGPLTFEAVAFDHPLYVLFSSGTTGLPKAIVHGHGGMLVEHLKGQGLGWDLKPGGRLMWYSTTAWMMWNALVAALLLRSSIVMIDGDPAWPKLDEQFRLAAETRPSVLGVSPALLTAIRKAGLHPSRDHDLSSVRVLATAGAPSPPETYRWVNDDLGLMFLNGSGGTDLCCGIVTGTLMQPVYEGEITSPALAVAAAAFDADGHPVVDELGELVITRPMPSMPVRFWNDPGDKRYHGTYFDRYPGVWRQGDWVVFTPRGSCIVSGRSDATLNRAGVRFGTGELYAVIEELDEIADSLIVHLEDPDGGAGELILFVVLADGVQFDGALRARIAGALRRELSPRHVPDRFEVVPAIPRTLTGKKLETPVKQILKGTPAAQVVNPGALADPASIDPFVALAGQAAQAG